MRKTPMTKGSKLLVGTVSMRIKGVTEWKEILEKYSGIWKKQKNADESEVRDAPIDCTDCLNFIAPNKKV
jgi:hypothetical protein